MANVKELCLSAGFEMSAPHLNPLPIKKIVENRRIKAKLIIKSCVFQI
jgi:hypothetical protein